MYNAEVKVQLKPEWNCLNPGSYNLNPTSFPGYVHWYFTQNHHKIDVERGQSRLRYSINRENKSLTQSSIYSHFYGYKFLAYDLWINYEKALEWLEELYEEASPPPKKKKKQKKKKINIIQIFYKQKKENKKKKKKNKITIVSTI